MDAWVPTGRDSDIIGPGSSLSAMVFETSQMLLRKDSHGSKCKTSCGERLEMCKELAGCCKMWTRLLEVKRNLP